MSKVYFTLNGQKVQADKGDNIVEACAKNADIIPALCYLPGHECLGTCRVCSVKVNGRISAACTLKIQEGMEIETDSDEVKDMQKALIELLFVEGNHYCPSCEKSGDCELQALAYKMEMEVSRFPYRFDPYEIDFTPEHILLERNRCIHCKRCTDIFRDDEGHKVFSFVGKGDKTMVEIDLRREAKLSHEKSLEAMEMCPVGAILVKGRGFVTPYGERKFDHHPPGESDG